MNRSSRFAATCIGLLSFLVAVPASGTSISVTNAGFEDISGETPVNEFTFGPLPGWDLYEGTPGMTDGGDGPTFFIGTLMPTAPEFFTTGAPEGQRVGIAFNYAAGGGTGEYGFVQTLADTLQANTAYSLSVDIGNIASGTSQSGDFFNLDGFPGYRVDLLAGGVVIAQDINGLGGMIPEGEFATTTIDFVTGDSHAQLGQQLGIRLVNLNVVDSSAPNADLEVDFDNVRFDATTVPEPSTMVLLLTAVFGLAGCVRGRRTES